jgi:tellurite resistance protein
MPAGRGAVPTFSMGLLLAAAALAPVAPGLAGGVWWAGLALHAGLAALLARELAAMPADGRPATAMLLVPFAGQIAAPLGGVALGWTALSAALVWSAIAVWLTLGPLALRRLLRAPPPPPMRPGAFILLAPPSLAATGFALTEAPDALATAAFAAACAVLVALLAAGRWLTAGGWTPAWGAFGFPSAAFAGAALVMAERRLGAGWDVLAAVALTAASLITLYVAGRTLAAWVTGKLAA